MTQEIKQLSKTHPNNKIGVKQVDIDQIIAATEDLAQILRQENICLEKFDIANIEHFQRKKIEIAEFLEFSRQALKESPDIIANIDQEKMVMAKKTQGNLQLLMEQNMKYISRAKSVNDKILEFVKKSLLEESNIIAGYNNCGNYGNKFKSANDMPALSILSEV
jgi:hypothetical protein